MLSFVVLVTLMFAAAFIYVHKSEKTSDLQLLAAAVAWPAAFIYQYTILGCKFGDCVAFVEMPFVWSALLMITVGGLSKLAKIYNAKFAMTLPT
ncbi:MAG: hypothetical protein WCE43_12310, partial [Burkholderiales bacterium]